MKYKMMLLDYKLPWTQAELARVLGVSRTHITLLVQEKRKLSARLADKLADALADYKADHEAGNGHACSRTSTPLGGVNSVLGGFDSHALPPIHGLKPNGLESIGVSPSPIPMTRLLTRFLQSRR